MDSGWRIHHYFRLLCPRLRKTALGGLLLNLNGPDDELKALRRWSMALYGTLVWAKALSKDRRSHQLLNGVQRLTNLRTTRAYRTMSAVGAGGLAGTPPLDLLAAEEKAIYDARARKRESGNTSRAEEDKARKKRAREKTI